MAAGKLRYVRLGQRNGTIRAQRGDRPVVHSRAIVREDRRAIGGELAADIIVVLDRDRQAGEPTRVVVGLAPERLRLRPRLVEETYGQCVNEGLYGLDARDGCLHHLQRRHVGSAKLVDGLSCRKLPELTHLLKSCVFVLPMSLVQSCAKAKAVAMLLADGSSHGRKCFALSSCRCRVRLMSSPNGLIFDRSVPSQDRGFAPLATASGRSLPARCRLLTRCRCAWARRCRSGKRRSSSTLTVTPRRVTGSDQAYRARPTGGMGTSHRGDSCTAITP